MAAKSILALMENRAAKMPDSIRPLTGRQVAAITLEAALGNQIQREFPQVVEGYRSGLTAPKLVDLYALDSRFGVNSQNAIAAVRNAIRGYKGHFHDSYNGLIPTPSERAKLALAHNRQTGIEASRQNIGIHALSSEQRADAGRKGGLIRGPLSYRLHIGCHALPPDVLREHCRKIAPLGGKAGGKASALARGLVPYAPATAAGCSELEFAFRLSTNPLYLGPVRANFNKIARKVNEAFNYRQSSNYTRITLKIALQRYRRQARSRGLFGIDPEMSLAERLASDPTCQIAPRIKAEQIACKVNDEYHNGQPVRNAIGIRAALRRYRQARTE
jgi:hypothetical protein